MTRQGVVLYGPPGVGKDTITRELERQRPGFVLFQRLKAGPGRTTGYRLSTLGEIETLRHQGAIVYENQRYGAHYAIDAPGLTALFDAGQVPVLHMGQVEGADAVARFPANWTKILLWCPRDVTAERCAGRGDVDLAARLKVWDETREDLLSHPASTWTRLIRTDAMTPAAVAQEIDSALASTGQDAVRALGADLP